MLPRSERFRIISRERNDRRAAVDHRVGGMIHHERRRAALHAGVLGAATTAAHTALNRTVLPDAMNLVLLIVLTFAQGMLMA